MKKRYYYSIASGSSGNCGLYVSEGTAILFDLGVSVRRLRQALAALEMDIQDLSAVLVTHEHTDHSKGLATFTKNYEVPIYATQPTAEALLHKVPQAEKNLCQFRGGESFSIHGISVQSFLTPHDAAESVGYVLDEEHHCFGYATDLGFIPAQVKEMLMGCDTVVLESNHDPGMLQNGPYPWPLKKRVGGPQGHLANPDCAIFACELAQSGTKTLVLAHLSEHNNTPLVAYRETRQALDLLGLSACEVYIAPKEAMGEPIALTGIGRQVCGL